MARTFRFSIGARIEHKFLDLLDLAYTAYFIKREFRQEKITECIMLLDTLKFLISVAWEAKAISNNQYEELALKLDEIGKMFGGWRNNLADPEKKNRGL